MQIQSTEQDRQQETEFNLQNTAPNRQAFLSFRPRKLSAQGVIATEYRLTGRLQGQKEKKTNCHILQSTCNYLRSLCSKRLLCRSSKPTEDLKSFWKKAWTTKKHWLSDKLLFFRQELKEGQQNPASAAAEARPGMLNHPGTGSSLLPGSGRSSFPPMNTTKHHVSSPHPFSHILPSNSSHKTHPSFSNCLHKNQRRRTWVWRAARPARAGYPA